MPTPINSVRTRVIDTSSGYVAQLSTDSMMWYDLPLAGFMQEVMDEPADTKYLATRVAMAAQQLPSMGRVIWQSDAS